MILFCSHRLIGICHFPVIAQREHKTPIPETERVKSGFGERTVPHALCKHLQQHEGEDGWRLSSAKWRASWLSVRMVLRWGFLEREEEPVWSRLLGVLPPQALTPVYSVGLGRKTMFGKPGKADHNNS